MFIASIVCKKCEKDFIKLVFLDFLLKGWYFYPNLESWLGRFYTHKSLEYPFAMSNTDPPAFLHKICIMYVWVHVLFTVSKLATCALSHLNSISILNPNKGFPIVRTYLSLMFPVVCCMWEKTLKTVLLFTINNITMLNLQRYVFPWTRKTCYSFIVALHQRHFKVFFIYLLFTLGTVASFVFWNKPLFSLSHLSSDWLTLTSQRFEHEVGGASVLTAWFLCLR